MDGGLGVAPVGTPLDYVHHPTCVVKASASGYFSLKKAVHFEAFDVARKPNVVAAMKRSREVAAEARKTVVRAASEMLRARGIDEVSVADAMAAAGMTHGGFYKLFEDKQALVEEAFDFASKESARAIRDSAMQAPSGGSLQAMADAYLSAEHRANPGSGCPLSAQVSDAARQESGFRRVFTTAVYRTLDSVMEIASRDGRPIRRQDALAMLASLVGALSLARATDDENLASEILASTRSRIAALVSGDSDGAGASAKQKKRPSKS